MSKLSKKAAHERITALEARLADLEDRLARSTVNPFDRIDVPSSSVDAHALWREQVADYASDGWYGTYI